MNKTDKKRLAEIKRKATRSKLSVCAKGSPLAIEATPRLSEEDAEYLRKLINRYEYGLRFVLYLFNLLQAWLPLGHNSFKEFVISQYGDENYQRYRRYLKTAEVLAHVAGEDAISKPYVDAAIAPLAALQPKQQKKVWQALLKDCGKETIPPKWLKAKTVTEKIQALGLAPDNVKPLEQGLSKAQKRDLAFQNVLTTLDPNADRYKFKVVTKWLKHYGPGYEQKLLTYLKERKAKKSQGEQHAD